MKTHDKPILFSYYRSSCSYRVRIALHHKSIPFEYRPVHLTQAGGEQNKKDYLLMNPRGEVPVFVHHGHSMTQSFAILQYIEGTWPENPLLPTNFKQQIRCFEICQMINAGIQPIQNLRVLQQLERQFGASFDEKKIWSAHWIQYGLDALEKELSKDAGIYCLGDKLSLADVFLVPQIYNARRFQVDLEAFPILKRIDEHCRQREDFLLAAPHAQIDTPPEEKSPNV